MRVCMLLHKSVVRDSRVRREAATLAAAGHDVTVLELAPVAAGEELLDGFRRRSVMPPGWVRRRLPFATYRAAFLACFVSHGRAVGAEVVHAHDAAMLAPGALLARLTGAQLVYDAHELATGVQYRSGAWERAVGALERALVPRCAAVITVSDGIAERMRERYRLAVRPTVLRNVSDLVDWAPAGGSRLRARLGLDDTDALVLHQGSAAPGRGCELLIEAVAGLEGVALALLGAGDEPGARRLRAAAAAAGAGDRVHVLPSVALDELLDHTREADVGVSLLSDSCDNHRLALPNKLFEYVAAGVPVVVSALPELERIVRRYGIGWTVDPADAGDVRDGLRRALAARGDPRLRERLRAAGRELRWPVERDRLLALYGELEAAQRERVRAAYRGYAADAAKRRAWAAANPGNALARDELLARILELTGPQRERGDALLDIGCGGGWWLERLHAAGVGAGRLAGVDLIAARVERARRRVPGARIAVADATELPFADACFGIVLLLTTLSSAGSAGRARRMLQEARRVLAPGGALVVYEPRLPSPRNRQTRRVTRRSLATRPGDEVSHEAITLLPAIGRRIGARNGRLARVAPLRSHRLTVVRAP